MSVNEKHCSVINMVNRCTIHPLQLFVADRNDDVGAIVRHTHVHVQKKKIVEKTK